MKLLLATLLTICTFAITANAQEKFLCRINNVNVSDARTDFKNKDVSQFIPDKYLEAVLTQDEIDELKTLGYNPVIRFTTQDLLNNLNIGNRAIEGYHDYNEVVQIMEQYVADYPEICQIYDIGDSQGKIYAEAGNSYYDDYNHEIWALKISDNVELNEDEPAIYYMGAHHAREPIGTEVILAVLEHIFDNYGSDDLVTNNVNNTEIWVVPIVNPDGHKYVIDGTDMWWRKNTRDNDLSGTINEIDGVDLNRNYGWEWGGAGVSFDMDDNTYPGPEAFSEPEIQSMKQLLADHHFTAGISYHSYGEWVLFPYAYGDGVTAPDHEILKRFAEDMAETIPVLNGSGHYTPQQCTELYPASGITDDWAYGEHGTLSFTIELAQQYIPSSSYVPQIQEDNIEAAMLLLDRINHNTVKGHITDAATGEPVQAKIHIDGIDNTGDYRKPYISNEEFGAYYRYLLEGAYDINYSSYGYIPQLIEDVLIIPSQATIVDIELTKAQQLNMTGTVYDHETGLPIEGAQIQILDTPLSPITTDEDGNFIIENTFEGSYLARISADGYSTVIPNINLTPSTNNFEFYLMELVQDGFEDELDEDWILTGDMAWMIDDDEAYEGEYSLKSGNISANQESILIREIEVSTQSEITFFRKVSSEAGHDFLTFYIDNVEKGKWSGEKDWEEMSFMVPSGVHQFKWIFSKDGGGFQGSNCAWVDLISFPPSVENITVNAGPDAEICHDEVLIINNAEVSNQDNIEWSTSGDGSFNDINSLSPEYTPGPSDIENGTVTLTLTASSFSQTASDDIEVTISICDDIKALSEKMKVKAFPNPARDQVWFNINGRTKIQSGTSIVLYDLRGNVVLSKQLTENQDCRIKVNQIPAGIYLYHLKSDSGQTQFEKLVIY